MWHCAKRVPQFGIHLNFQLALAACFPAPDRKMQEIMKSALLATSLCSHKNIWLYISRFPFWRRFLRLFSGRARCNNNNHNANTWLHFGALIREISMCHSIHFAEQSLSKFNQVVWEFHLNFRLCFPMHTDIRHTGGCGFHFEFGGNTIFIKGFCSSADVSVCVSFKYLSNISFNLAFNARDTGFVSAFICLF